MGDLGGRLPVISVVGMDLDDTLLRLSPQFVPEYLKRIIQRLEEIFPQTPGIGHAFWESGIATREKARDAERLEDFFYRDFGSRTGLTRRELDPHLHAFYRNEFHQLRYLARPIFGVMGLLAALKARGYRVALLTSALFPKEAIDQRLQWAGLEGFSFDWRASLEVVHVTKPQPDYYREAAEALDTEPRQWLMVGNDLREDILPAHEAGMATYWVREDALPQDLRDLPTGVAVGPLQRVISWLDG